MKVNELKEILERALETLDCYEDEQEVRLASSTYHLGHPHAFLGIGGYDGGYISLDEYDIEEAIQIAEEEDEYDED